MTLAAEPIVTERLILRRLTPDDFDRLFALFQDPLVMRYYPGLKDAAQTRAWLDWVFSEYAARGHGLMAVELAATGEFVGQVGLIRQVVDGAEEVEIGYLLRSECWHLGYATEAACACRDYGFKVLRRDRLISLIRPENSASIRVAERVGMTPERSIERRGIRHTVYSIIR
jgi:ribosomal-protein-alanine N-acetyltransferase